MKYYTERERREHRSLDCHQRLQDNEESSLVNPIGDDPAVGPEQEDGERLECDDHADRRRRVRQHQHEP